MRSHWMSCRQEWPVGVADESVGPVIFFYTHRTRRTDKPAFESESRKKKTFQRDTGITSRSMFVYMYAYRAQETSYLLSVWEHAAGVSAANRLLADCRATASAKSNSNTIQYTTPNELLIHSTAEAPVNGSGTTADINTTHHTNTETFNIESRGWP